MKANKRRATFGRAYWLKPHPDVTPFQATVYILRRDWRTLRWTMKRWTAPVVGHIGEAFIRLNRAARTALQSMTKAAQAAKQDLTLDWERDREAVGRHAPTYDELADGSDR